MKGSWRPIVLTFVLSAGPSLAPAAAQSLGSFSWQLAPYCNIITVNVTQNGAIYTLDGYDDQCRAPERAAVSGTAFLNPNGQVGLGLTIVTTTAGRSVHVDAALDLATLGGTWRDDQGNVGGLLFAPAGPGMGSPRPLGNADIPDGSILGAKLADGAVTAAKVNASEVQRRVSGACPPGQMMTSVGSAGSVTCAAPPTATGDITAVTAGVGLTGGATSGNATLNVNFGGSGTASAVARSDHFHGVGLLTSSNTALGNGSLAAATAPGSNNTAVGHAAMAAMVAGGSGNTGVGAYAMEDQTDGIQNTAVGSFALQSNTSGSMNTAIGREALYQLVGQSLGVGSRNTAIGKAALSDLGDGYTNTAIGAFAGDGLTNGRDNIYIGSAAGGATENFTTRIGTAFAASRTFVTGIRGVTTGVNDAVAVVIDSTGQLGTVSSSRRTKFDIADLDASSTAALQRLRPVQFRYRQAFADGSTPLQYGLIAEEVNEVLPELVAEGVDGSPETVKYHVLPALLLADLQRLERERARLGSALELESARVADLEQRLTAQARALDELRRLVEPLMR